MKAYVYILCCSDGTFYTGWTNSLQKRLECHRKGKGSKYTRVRRPVRLIYFEEFNEKSKAMKREYAIKQLSRKEKEKLISQDALKSQCDEFLEKNLKKKSL